MKPPPDQSLPTGKPLWAGQHKSHEKRAAHKAAKPRRIKPRLIIPEDLEKARQRNAAARDALALEYTVNMVLAAVKGAPPIKELLAACNELLALPDLTEAQRKALTEAINPTPPHE